LMSISQNSAFGWKILSEFAKGNSLG
jgi:hypothetical protein